MTEDAKLADKAMQSVGKPEPRQVLREAPGYGAWVAVEDKLPDYNKKVLVLDGDNMFCAILQNVTRHIGKDSPRDNRWFALPGWGHELKSVTDWCDLPEAP